ncbi:hypothetical protein [Saccharopolyspora endophytica]|uniref:Uncharacterized protein n=1 Tax=Saccharopolyspora endophytica TaxID=543886 RepID=A0ABS5D807_9PSEU|nr:hypothetical protein [Saccharopolyspora endophytica]MBQ0922395.1 hypothetical protein [Saccharopolyspora endophytica]
MDEVNAMAKAGETVGKAVGTGIKQARHGAKHAGETGAVLSRQAAARAEQELANRGYSTEELQELIAQRATGKSRKELAKQAKQARKDWEKRTTESRKRLAARIDPTPVKKKRRWPWLLLMLVVLGIAAAAIALTRRPEELPLAAADDEPWDSHTPGTTPPRHRAAAETDGHQEPRGVETPRANPPTP